MAKEIWQLSPRTGTHLQHALAAISNLSVPSVMDTEDGWFDRSVMNLSESPFFGEDRTVSVREFGEMWCEMFGLFKSAQPVNPVEGAIEEESEISCLEVNNDPFVRMIFCIHGLVEVNESRPWNAIRLHKDFFMRHFVELEYEEV